MQSRLADVVGRVRAAGDRRATLPPEVPVLVDLLRSEHGLDDAGGRLDPDAAPADGDDEAARLARLFGLSALDLGLLVIAAAPDLDARFGAVFGALLGSTTAARSSAGLALELCGHGPLSGPARARLGPLAPLVRSGLLSLIGDEPLPVRPLSVPDRVVAQLLGDDTPHPTAERLLVHTPGIASQSGQRLARGFLAGADVGHVRSRPGAAGPAVARGAFDVLGLPALVVDLGRRRADDDAATLLDLVVREAALRGAGLVLALPDDLGAALPGALPRLAQSPVPVVVVDDREWEATWLDAPPVTVEASELPVEDRAALWRRLVPELAPEGDDLGDDGWRDLLGLRLSPQQIVASAGAARLVAATDERELDVATLRVVARESGSTRLAGSAERISPRARLDDLVLTPTVRAEVEEVVQWARHREALFSAGRLAGRGTKGRGLTALFAGSPGTGKTLAAEAVAGELGLDLYTVELSSLVDKYIGETEKNLERVFREAESLNVVLFFDEADALFGSRGEVREARDRYANQEVSYLLQRMERFDGLAVLATNLRGNIDSAFTRRIHHVITFTDPDATGRRELFHGHLEAVPSLDPQDPPDLDWLADKVELTGGPIRNIVLAAAFSAAVEGRPLGMRHLVAAVQREHVKLSRRAPVPPDAVPVQAAGGGAGRRAAQDLADTAPVS